MDNDPYVRIGELERENKRLQRKLHAFESALTQELQYHRACLNITGSNSAVEIIGFHRGVQWALKVLAASPTPPQEK